MHPWMLSKAPPLPASFKAGIGVRTNAICDTEEGIASEADATHQRWLAAESWLGQL